MRALIAATLALVAPRIARADEPPPVDEPPPPAPPQEPAPPAEPLPAPDALAVRIDDLDASLERLEKKLAAQDRRIEVVHREVQDLQWLRRFITVYIDVGAFAVGGDGSGIRSDLDHVYFPQYAGRVPGQWVFMGDPLSTAINSLGEPADASDSRELTTDALKSHGHPSLILNSLGLAIGKDVGHGFAVAALAELLPRPGSDRVDVELAHVDYRPSDAIDLVISAGKIDSVLGIEYRSQDAPRRLGVTPSLICRYTCGRPIGVEARLVRGALSTSASITNGDNFDERFEPETTLHPNTVPTAAGHVQWTLPVGQGLEVGVSGAVGPQTNQGDTGVVQWHYGFDVRLTDLDRFDITAEFVQGHEPGKTTMMALAPCDLAPCLSYKGAYLLIDRRMNPRFTPYVRFDWRDAVHENGVNFVYESHVARATFGAHFAVTSRILAKIEYTYNRELDNIPQFPDDVLTTSLVVATD
jgi:hypothetical protein